MVRDHHLLNHSLCGVQFVVASPVHLLSLSFAPKQLKQIRNSLFPG